MPCLIQLIFSTMGSDSGSQSSDRDQQRPPRPMWAVICLYIISLKQKEVALQYIARPSPPPTSSINKCSLPTRCLVRVACLLTVCPGLLVSPGRKSLPHSPRRAANAFLPSHRRSDPESLPGPRHGRSIRAATPVSARRFLQHVLCIIGAIFRLPRTAKPP